MAYNLVRTLVHKRGVGIRETVWVGVWFGRSRGGRCGRRLCTTARLREVEAEAEAEAGCKKKSNAARGRFRERKLDALV